METHRIIKNSDSVRLADLQELARYPGPTVTVTIPTHRGGAETLSDAQRLRPILADARTDLTEHSPDVDADTVLAHVEALAASRRFWQEQCDGLAIYASPRGSKHFRVAVDFPPQLSVGEHVNLRPLLPLVASDLEFLLVAISQKKVRLFSADQFSITELPLGNIPASAQEVEGVTTREPQLQHQSSPGRDAPVHGHGPRDYNVLRGFLQAVGKSLEARFSGDSRPLIVASVDEYYGPLQEQLNTVALLGRPVAGNPDLLSELELHEKVWPLAVEEREKRHRSLLDNLGRALGTGLASSDPGDIARSAEDGRVAVLVISQRALTSTEPAEDIDAAIANTLVYSGQVDIVPELPGGHRVGAIYRY